MKKAIVHIGTHKTATTSLQSFFERSRPALAAQGVSYLPLNEMRKSVTPLICSHRKEDRRKLRELALCINHDIVILSDENIIGDSSELYRGELYQFAPIRVKNICDIFSPAKIEIYLVLRRPDGFIKSMYCEYIRHNTFVSFNEYIKNIIIEEFSYRRIFDWVFELPEAVAVHILDMDQGEIWGPEQAARAMLVSACVDPHSVDYSLMPSDRSRSSFSMEEITLFGKIAEAAGGNIVKQFIRMLEAKGQRFGKTKFDPMSDSLVTRLNARYQEDIIYLSQRGQSSVND